MEKQRSEITQAIDDIKKTKPSAAGSDAGVNTERLKAEIMMSVKQAVKEEVAQQSQQQMQELRSWFESEVRNIYKELGLVKSEVEFVTNFDRK